MTKVTLLDLYESLSNEEKKEFIGLIINEIKKVVFSTFLEQYHNSLKATGDKPLSVK